MNKLLTSLLLTLCFSAHAETITTNLTATANLVSSCKVSISSINFNFTPQPTGEHTVSTNIRSLCSKDAAYVLSINPGLGSPSFLNRRLYGTEDGSSEYLSYNLYKEDGVSIWGDGTAGSQKHDVVGTGVEQTVPVIAKINLNQYKKADIYASSLTVTLQY